MCIVGILHFYKGYIPPLIFQSVLLPINFIDSQLFKIHVLKEAPVGGLKRPFKVEGPFKCDPPHVSIVHKCHMLISRCLRAQVPGSAESTGDSKG
jgi:hypothetical protein